MTTPPSNSEPRGTENTLLVGNPSTKAITGLSIQFDSLIRGMRERSLPTTIIDRSAGGDDDVAGSFSLRRALRTLGLIGELLYKLPSTKRVYLTLGSSRAGFLRDMLMILPAAAARRRIVAQLHGGGYRDFHAAQPKWVRLLMKWVLSKADRIIVEGELLRDQFWFVERAAERVVVVPNGVPTPSPPAVVRTLGSSDPLRLLYLSNLLDSKGYLDVLSACRILQERLGRALQCDFCGAFVDTRYDTRRVSSAEALASFQRQVRDWKLEYVVRFHGTVTGEAKDRFLREAHVLVLPTSYPGEGQPVSIIEALSFGVPVVATRYRGIPELIEDGTSGIFVPFGDPAAIALAVARMAASPTIYSGFSKGALARFTERLTEESHVDGVLAHVFGPPPLGMPGEERIQA